MGWGRGNQRTTSVPLSQNYSAMLCWARLFWKSDGTFVIFANRTNSTNTGMGTVGKGHNSLAHLHEGDPRFNPSHILDVGLESPLLEPLESHQ